jgi:hypothetical protein
MNRISSDVDGSTILTPFAANNAVPVGLRITNFALAGACP